jgi:hypothetical protein
MNVVDGSVTKTMLASAELLDCSTNVSSEKVATGTILVFRVRVKALWLAHVY